MASSSRRQIDENSRRSNFPAKGQQFFKIIHHGVIQDRKLRIPREFMKRYGNHLSNPVFLKVPSGDIWTVELVRSDRVAWLRNGWQEFTEYYSIRYGHFLVFRYDGNSHFHVLIFDTSASEIEYPFSATTVQQTNNTGGCKVLDDDSVEVLNDFPTIQTREKIPEFDLSVRLSDDFPTKRTTSNTMPSCEAMVTNPTIKTENTTNSELAKSSADGDNSNSLKREIKKECTKGTVTTTRHLHTKVRRRSITDNEKVRALRRAEAYKSEDPFFVIFMQPAYVKDKISLSVPLVIAKKYFADNHTIILCVSDERTWSVKCRFGASNAKLTSGWRSFVEDNHLQVGDVCVFQLIKAGIEPSLKVIIF